MKKIEVYLPPDLAAIVIEDADKSFISWSAKIRQIVAAHYSYSQGQEGEKVRLIDVKPEESEEVTYTPGSERWNAFEKEG